MFFKKALFFGVILSCYSAAALSQSTFYHCAKGGEKIISDQPCAELGAKETKRVEAKDLTPLNTVQGVSQEEKRQPVPKTRVQQVADTSQQQGSNPASRAKDQGRERQCADLLSKKDDIVALQRQRNSEQLEESHRKVNDEIYRLECGFLR